MLLGCWSKYWAIFRQCKTLSYWCRSLEISKDICFTWCYSGFFVCVCFFYVFGNIYKCLCNLSLFVCVWLWAFHLPYLLFWELNIMKISESNFGILFFVRGSKRTTSSFQNSCQKSLTCVGLSFTFISITVDNMNARCLWTTNKHLQGYVWFPFVYSYKPCLDDTKKSNELNFQFNISFFFPNLARKHLLCVYFTG